MAIKPGNLGHKADPFPIPSAFANSMAAAIEAELNILLEADGLPALDIDNSPESRDRRRLFAAIARGVVRHLRDNLDAIKVERLDSSQVSPTMQVEGL
jgi:hypothetical protein